MIERRSTAAWWSATLLVAVSAPVVQNFRRAPRDSFPLSHYPMFSAARGEVVEVTHLVGTTTGGDRVVLPCSLLGLGGMNQHRKQLRRARHRPDRLTRRVARRVATRPIYGGVATVGS